MRQTGNARFQGRARASRSTLKVRLHLTFAGHRVIFFIDGLVYHHYLSGSSSELSPLPAYPGGFFVSQRRTP